MVKRKTATLMAINARVTTGQRRAVIFSCLIGTNIGLRPPQKSRHTSRQCSFARAPFPDDARSCPIFSNRQVAPAFCGLPRGRLALAACWTSFHLPASFVTSFRFARVRRSRFLRYTSETLSSRLGTALHGRWRSYSGAAQGL